MGSDPLADYQWLISPAAREALQTAAEALHQQLEPSRCIARLRKELSPARAGIVWETVNLRVRGAAKFERSGEMFFTSKGLEQATDQWIARYKASHFPPAKPIVDWCMGIGGDLVELAHGRVWQGIDRDPVMQLLAAQNVSAYCEVPLQQAISQTAGDISQVTLAADGYWHLDPDRRETGKRTTRLEAFSPSLEEITDWVETHPHGCLKIAPASSLPEKWQALTQREWISRKRECRQQVVWFGELASYPGEHVATILSSVQQDAGWQISSHCVHGDPSTTPPTAASLGNYLFEPDAAVLAAGLTGLLAVQANLQAIAPGSVYLTGDELHCSPALAAFRVLDLLPFDLRRLKNYCRTHDIGRLEIKKRGVDVVPEQLRQQLALAGERAFTLFVTRIAQKHIAIVAERIETSDSSL